jgi:hypothetical protein
MWPDLLEATSAKVIDRSNVKVYTRSDVKPGLHFYVIVGGCDEEWATE